MSTVVEYERFTKLWNRCLLSGASDNSEDIHQQLLNSYNEPQRIYHTLAHIEHCLSIFDRVKHLVKHPDSLELSIWFHDVIYEIAANDNEQKSADLFMSLTANIFNDNCRHSVYENIMATLHTRDVPIAGDARYMVDIDLSSFGLPWDDFMHDSENVRAERSDIPANEAYKGQLNFKQTLLECPRFFITNYFFEHYETQAKENLERFCTLMAEKLGINCNDN